MQNRESPDFKSPEVGRYAVVCVMDLLFTHFSGQFIKICTNIRCTCPCQRFKVFMLNINFTKNSSKAMQNRLSVILIMPN